MSSSIFYSACDHEIYYSKVCGQIRGYQFGSPDRFRPLYASNVIPNIDNCNTYVDGVTITYGSNPRKHIWTYACGVRNFIIMNIHVHVIMETTSTNFVGHDYFCESGKYGIANTVLYSNDILWDGQQFGGL